MSRVSYVFGKLNSEITVPALADTFRKMPGVTIRDVGEVSFIAEVEDTFNVEAARNEYRGWRISGPIKLAAS